MKLNIIFVLLASLLICANPADLVQEILNDTNSDSALVVNTSSVVTSQSAIPYSFKSYDCPKCLSENLLSAVDNAIASGNLPILVCDIDETLIKKNTGHPLPTDLYSYLRGSGVIFKVHGLLALTARSVTTENIIGITQNELNLCVPEFVTCMKAPDNLGRLSGLDFSAEKRFLHSHGLIIMGEGGLTKRQTSNIYLQSVLQDSNQKYELLFVDNDIGWFGEFCNGTGYDPKIVKGNFFHYKWETGENIQKDNKDDERAKELGDLNSLRNSITAQLAAARISTKTTKVEEPKYTVVEHTVVGRFESTDYIETEDLEWRD